MAFLYMRLATQSLGLGHPSLGCFVEVHGHNYLPGLPTNQLGMAGCMVAQLLGKEPMVCSTPGQREMRERVISIQRMQCITPVLGGVPHPGPLMPY